MRNLRPLLVASLLVTAGGITMALGCSNNDDDEGEGTIANLTEGSDLVISQVFGAGGTSHAPFSHDFVELFNRGKTPINLAGKSLQYTTSVAAFKSDDNIVALPDFTLAPGQYYLIQLGGGDRGDPLPTPDLAPANAFGLNAKKGKLAIVLSDAPLTCGGSGSACVAGTTWIDLVGYGPTVSLAEGDPTKETANETGALRSGQGCADTNNNKADFEVATPTPRNSASTKVVCRNDVDGGADGSASSDDGSTGEGGGPSDDGSTGVDGGPTTPEAGPTEGSDASTESDASVDSGTTPNGAGPGTGTTAEEDEDPAPDDDEKPSQNKGTSPGSSGSSGKTNGSGTSGSAKNAAKPKAGPDSSGCSTSPAGVRTQTGGAFLTFGGLGIALASLVRRRRPRRA